MKRKLIALGLAGTMVMAPMSVCAADGGQDTGSGTVEGVVDLEVYDVEFPTEAVDVFDFKLDPQGLIFETDGAAHNDIKPAEGTTVVFSNYTDGSVTGMSDTSDAVVVKNLGAVQVDVTVTATVTSDLTMSADSTFADGGQLYLALKGSDAATAVVDATTKVATLKGQMNAIEASNFEYTYADGEYAYTLNSTYDTDSAPSYSFQLTGAADADAAWVGDETADVAVVWTLAEHVNEVAAYATWDDAGAIWMGLDSETGFDGTTLTSFSINGTTTDKATLADGWISIPWTEIDAVDGDNPATWDIEAVIDGVTYTATL